MAYICDCNRYNCKILINRALNDLIRHYLPDKRTLVILGPRRVGKTTLLRSVQNENKNVLFLNGDEKEIQTLFESGNVETLKKAFGSNEIVILDEAQRITNIGLSLKLITDDLPQIKLIVSGSSAFHLNNSIQEMLTGRKWDFKMYPLSYSEMVGHHGWIKEKLLLSHRMVYGYYPDVVLNDGLERKILRELLQEYLYKDILLWQDIKKSDKLYDLLRALAYQVGHEVNYTQLGKLIHLDNETIEKYIVLLEQCFIIFRLNAYSRNLRNEIKRGKKIYFFDNGVRNALISNFQQLELRNDIDALWENFIVSERMKKLEYTETYPNNYFWRTTDQAEIDYLEDMDGILSCYEFKWNPSKGKSIPASFIKAYPQSNYTIIHRENFEDFIGLKVDA